MSKIDDLIKQYCPNGVESKRFEEIASYIRGITYNKNQESKNGEGIKVLRANNISLKTSTLNYDDVKIVSNLVKVKENQFLKEKDILICAGSGSKEHIGKVAYITKDINYTFGGFMGVIRCNNTLNSRYLFHILRSSYFLQHLDKELNSSTINNLSSQIMNSFRFPVPPLPVQEEIVKVLDSFTALEAELEAELEARKRQYEYYRNKLLTFDENTTGGGRIKFMQLGEIYDFKYGKGNTIPTVGGEYPVYGSNGIVGTHNEYNSENAPVIGHIGAYAGIVNYGLGKHFVTYNGVICKIKNKKVLPKYGYYLLLLQNFMEQAKDGSQPFISYEILEKPVVSVPPLEEQERIVAILDKFDSLVNDISEGLPAELNARRQQYEYYRNKLLTFDEAA